jgi:hypothetical protein
MTDPEPVGLTPRQRLARLRKVIANTPAQAIHMSAWVSQCGTTACIAGHGAQDPVLQAEGLELTDGPWPSPTVNGNPVGNIGLSEFFGISNDAGTVLFYSDDARPRHQTKDRQLALIDRLLKEPVTT